MGRRVGRGGSLGGTGGGGARRVGGDRAHDQAGGAAHEASRTRPGAWPAHPAAGSVAPSRADRVPRIPGVTVRRRIRRPFKRGLLSKLMSVGAMLGAAAMMVATTVPANAFYSVDSATHSPLAVAAPVQSLSVPTDADPAASVGRDAYTVSSLADQIRIRFGSRSFSYTNDPTGTHPVAVHHRRSDQQRVRRAQRPCGGCSSYHEGVDFVPGAGASIRRSPTAWSSAVMVSHAGLGDRVIVGHMVNGRTCRASTAT